MEKSRANITKTTPPSEWFRNVAKSVGYSSANIIKDITPNIHSMVGDNISYTKELADQLKNSASDSQSITSLFNADSYVKIAKSAINNAYEDILSGNIYNRDRQAAAFEDEEFGDLDLEGLPSFDSFDTDDKVETKEGTTINKTVNNNVTVNKISPTDNVNKVIQASAAMNKASTNAIIDSTNRMLSTKAAMDHNLAMGQLKGLETINENIGQLVNFQNDSMAKYIGASIQYYDESLTVMRQSLEKMTAIAPIPRDESRRLGSGYDDVFAGGTFGVEGYIQNVKRNFDKLKDENFLVNSLFTMGSNTEHLQYLANAPLKFIADTVTKQIIPLTIRSTMERLDKSVTEFIPAIMSRFSRMGQSSNPIVEIIGKLFGIDTKIKTSPRMQNYERGAIPFDGETKRAITDVIPTYLRKMYAHMTGTKEIAFDWETGMWSDVKSMRDNYNKEMMRQVTAGYGDVYNELTGYMQDIRFNTDQERTKMEEGINKFFLNLSKDNEVVRLDMSDESKRKVRELSGLDNSNLSELLSAMLNNLDNASKMSTVNNYRALSNMEKFFANIEENPTVMNATTLLTGLANDEHIELDADGNVKALKKYKAGAFGSRKIDEYGKDSLYYLRGIMDTLVSGIKVFDSEDADGKLDERALKFKSMERTKAQEVQSTRQNKTLSDNQSRVFRESGGIDLTARSMDSSTFNQDIAELKAKRMSEGKSHKDAFGDTIGGLLDAKQEKFYRTREALDTIVRKPADVLEAAFTKIDSTLYNIVFGVNNNGRGSFMDGVLDKMTDMFDKVSDYAIERVFLPVKDFLGGVFSKVGGAAKDNFLVQSIKDGVKYWFVGEDEDGVRKGGVFSEIMNSTKDVIKGFSHTVTGIEYKDSKGVTHAKNPDSFFGSTKNLVMDIYNSTKAHFFGDKESSDPDRRTGIVTNIGNMLGDGIQDWKSVIFGKEKDPNKQGTDVLRENATAFIKNAPKGLIGVGAGALAGSALYGGGLGWLGSFLLPGGPLGMALVGGALGMASGSETFKNWAFGEHGGNGERMGGALISYNTKEFWKRNKNTIIGGAIGGLALSAASNMLFESVFPGAGFITEFLSPFGPIGSAMQGIGTALIMKSDTLLSWLFGAKNADGARMGGMIQRIFRKPNMEISKRAVGNKLGFNLIGLGAGAAAGMTLSSVLPTMGILGAMLATPIGPVTGAVAGLAAAIALSSDKVRTILFGSKNEYDGKQGLIEKMVNSVHVNVIEPIANSAKVTGQHMINWFMNKHLPRMLLITEPLVKAAKDMTMGVIKTTKAVMLDIPITLAKWTGKTISTSFKYLKDMYSSSALGKTIEEKITKPMIDTVNRWVSAPFRKLSSGIMGAASFVVRGLNDLGTSIMMAPAYVVMALDQAKSATKSILSGVGNMFKGMIDLARGRNATDSKGMMVGGGLAGAGALLRDAFSGRRIYADMKSDPSSSYVDVIMNNYRESTEKYKERRQAIKDEQREWRDEWDQRRGVKGETKYYGWGRNRRLNPEETAKFIKEFEKKTGGISVHEALGIDPRVPIRELTAQQVKNLNGIIKNVIRTGKKGDAFRDHSGITKYQRSQEEALRSIDDEIAKSNDILGNIHTAILSITDGTATPVITIASASTDEIGASVAKATEDALDITSSSSRVYDEAKDSVIKRISYGRRSYLEDEDESEGGSIGGLVSKSARKALNGILPASMRKYTAQQVNEIGCGPIVLALVLSQAGIRTTAEKIFNYAMDNGLVEPGIGVSSKIFKLYANKHGLKYAYMKPSKQAIERAFNLTTSAIVRLNTGDGHYVVLRGYKDDGTVIVTDPMGKYNGLMDIDKLLPHITHIYLVYKSGIKNFLNTTISKFAPRASSSVANTNFGESTGGSIDKVISRGKLAIPATLKANEASLTPVLVIKTKDEEKLENERHEELLNAILMIGGFGGGSGGGSGFGGMSGTASTVRANKLGLNRINTLLGLASWAVNGYRNRRNRNESSNRGGDGGLDIGGMLDLAQSLSGRRMSGGMGKAVGLASAYNAAGKSPTSSRSSGGRLSSIGAGSRRALGFLGGISNIAAKTSSLLAQAGTVASSANLRGIPGGYSTSSGAEDEFVYQDNGTSLASQKQAFNKRKNVNYYLSQRAQQATADAEAKFSDTMVDLSSRIEVNTRITSQLLADMLDLQKDFFDWLKKFLENLDFCCDGGPGGGSGPGNPGPEPNPPIPPAVLPAIPPIASIIPQANPGGIPKGNESGGIPGAKPGNIPGKPSTADPSKSTGGDAAKGGAVAVNPSKVIDDHLPNIKKLEELTRVGGSVGGGSVMVNPIDQQAQVLTRIEEMTKIPSVTEVPAATSTEEKSLMQKVIDGFKPGSLNEHTEGTMLENIGHMSPLTAMLLGKMMVKGVQRSMGKDVKTGGTGRTTVNMPESEKQASLIDGKNDLKGKPYLDYDSIKKLEAEGVKIDPKLKERSIEQMKRTGKFDQANDLEFNGDKSKYKTYTLEERQAAKKYNKRVERAEKFKGTMGKARNIATRPIAYGSEKLFKGVEKASDKFFRTPMGAKIGDTMDRFDPLTVYEKITDRLPETKKQRALREERERKLAEMNKDKLVEFDQSKVTKEKPLIKPEGDLVEFKKKETPMDKVEAKVDESVKKTTTPEVKSPTKPQGQVVEGDFTRNANKQAANPSGKVIKYDDVTTIKDIKEAKNLENLNRESYKSGKSGFDPDSIKMGPDGSSPKGKPSKGGKDGQVFDFESAKGKKPGRAGRGGKGTLGLAANMGGGMLDGLGDLAGKAGKFGSKLIKNPFTKGIGKTVAKFGGAAVTGGALAAGMTALDAKYGYDNAASILKKDEGDITGADRAAAATAQSVVGFIPFVDMIDEALGGHAKEWIGKFVLGIGGVWDKITTTVTEGWETVKTSIGEKVTGIVDAAKEKWEGVKTFVSEGWDNLKTSVVEKVTNIVEAAKEKWEAVKTSVSEGWETLKASVIEKATNIVEGTKQKWEAVKTTISEKWESMKSSVTEKLTSIITSAKEKWESIKSAIGEKWESMKTSITGKMESIITSAKEKWEGIKNSIGEKWDGIKSEVLGKFESIKKTITDKIQSAIDLMPSFSLSDIVSSIKTTIGDKIKSAVSALSIDNLWSWVTGKGKGGPSNVGGPSEDDALKIMKEQSKAKDLTEGLTYAEGCKPCEEKKKQIYGNGDFYQIDARWAGDKLADGATMSTSGCGPTVAATMVKSMTGSNVTPKDAAKYARDKGLVDPQKGVSSEIFSGFGKSYGLDVAPTLSSKDNIMAQLSRGNKVVLRGEKGSNYTDSGHYVLADGLTADGKINIKDPLGRSRSGEFDMDSVAKGLTHAFAVSGNGQGLAALLGDKKNPDAIFAKGSSGFSNPNPKGRVTSPYGWRNIGSGREFHWGIDISNGGGTNIQAAADGTVMTAGPKGTYGNVVIIKHEMNGKRMDTVYAHLKTVKVQVGQTVKQGQIIGIEGSTGRSTGPHLHFEIHNGPYKYGVNNVDPAPYIFKNGVPTPKGFEDSSGILAGATAGAAATAGAKAAAAASAFDPASGFKDMSFIPDALKDLPTIMKNANDMMLFGAPISILAGTSMMAANAISDAGEALSTAFNPSGDKKKFIDNVKPGAIKGYAEHKVLPSLTLAQAALESGWGKKAIGNNLFGIKAGAGWTGKTKKVWTTEYVNGKQQRVQALFRDYDSIEDSILDHTKLMLNPRYAKVLQATNYREATKAVKDAGYATDPNYTNLLNNLIESNGFMQVDTQAGVTMKGGPKGGPAFADAFNIYKELEGTKFDKATYGNGCGCKGGPEVKDALELTQSLNSSSRGIETISNTYDKVADAAYASGKRMEKIHEENMKMEKFTKERERVYASGSNITNIIPVGDAWSEENVERAINALETIAYNTSSQNNSNVNVTNNNINQPSGNPSNPPVSRQTNTKLASRNSAIAKVRK